MAEKDVHLAWNDTFVIQLGRVWDLPEGLAVNENAARAIGHQTALRAGSLPSSPVHVCSLRVICIRSFQFAV